jgi:hypothetical protein
MLSRLQPHCAWLAVDSLAVGHTYRDRAWTINLLSTRVSIFATRFNVHKVGVLSAQCLCVYVFNFICVKTFVFMMET